MEETKQFLTGAEVVVQACRDAGATSMYGYPITPGTEILSGWIRRAQGEKGLQYLQTEDEIAAGFAVCGAVIAGVKAFTATAGPGTVLMQDSLSMAEGMRLPVVVIDVQRGGPSSGTVIYSQQEVNLAIHGGNGEGQRIVYSPGNLSELYKHTRLAFNYAWQYRFPAIVLSDGFVMKTRQLVDWYWSEENVSPTPLISPDTQKNIRNIYTFEEELNAEIEKNQKDFELMGKKIQEAEENSEVGADILLVAHGLVAQAALVAAQMLRSQGKKISVWRPITLSPFPADSLNVAAEKHQKIVVVESSLGQLTALIKNSLRVGREVETILRPALGIEPEEIIKRLNV
ncbi:MAG TPA: transketolase C-terminal domain-containing protein [Patescibacteria group bacterium]|nr:transketolase C-terminal domain-containing protein [Patescibacteria group bacterium]